LEEALDLSSDRILNEWVNNINFVRLTEQKPGLCVCVCVCERVLLLVCVCVPACERA
jgi:hypothetical protein